MSAGVNSHRRLPLPGSSASVRPYVVVITITSRLRPRTVTPASSIADESTVPGSLTVRTLQPLDVAGGDAGRGRPDPVALGVVVEPKPVRLRDLRPARPTRPSTRWRSPDRGQRWPARRRRTQRGSPRRTRARRKGPSSRLPRLWEQVVNRGARRLNRLARDRADRRRKLLGHQCHDLDRRINRGGCGGGLGRDAGDGDDPRTAPGSDGPANSCVALEVTVDRQPAGRAPRARQSIRTLLPARKQREHRGRPASRRGRPRRHSRRRATGASTPSKGSYSAMLPRHFAPRAGSDPTTKQPQHG